MDDINKKVPCRSSQLNELFLLLGESDECLPHSLFLSGNTATGKTLCVDTVLQYLGYKQVLINCIECYSSKIICENILAGLCDEETPKCEDALKDLITGLKSLQKVYKFEPIILVFDKAERLRNMDAALMCIFTKLREFCCLNICTIFITDLLYENFYFKNGLRDPIKIYFPNYNKEEMFRIIFMYHKTFLQHVTSNCDIDMATYNELEKPELFGNYLNSFLSVFYRPCRELIELRHMALVNFAKYCEPIIKKEVNAQDLTKLWRHISPILRTSLELLYLRIDTTKCTPTSPGKENKWTEAKPKKNLEDALKEELISTKTFAQSFELPYYTKYLLIAAYLASYNPSKEDKRLFMKNHGKRRKRLQEVRAKAKISEKLNTQLGPKAFTLDRLLAIFYAILEHKIGLTSNLLSQIATLVELKLISGSKEIDLDSAKYKCIVGYDFISAVAQTVGFNVKKYLYDFL